MHTRSLSEVTASTKRPIQGQNQSNKANQSEINTSKQERDQNRLPNAKPSRHPIQNQTKPSSTPIKQQRLRQNKLNNAVSNTTFKDAAMGHWVAISQFK